MGGEDAVQHARRAQSGRADAPLRPVPGPAYSAASDEQLLAWSASGDRRAFDEIVVRHGPFALRVAARLVLDRALAEDIVQEAFVRVWSKARTFDPARAQLRTWLYRIVAHLCIDQRRRARPLPLPEHFDRADPAIGAHDMMEQTEQQASLMKALSELPARQRAAVMLIYDEGLSGGEAASILGLTAKAVERLLARARARLRELLVHSPPGKENHGR